MVLLRTADAARRLGVSSSFLEKARVNGSGPSYVKIGRAVAYRDVDIDAWVASLVRQSTSARALGQAVA
jgi:predicted DNA-binding transcriptional regulator AlpA